MEKFTDSCWTAAGDTYKKLLAHPFITELAAGTLPRKIFARYVQQDDLYIVDDARALALAGLRAPNADEMLFFLGQAYESLRIEKSLHDDIFRAFSVRPVMEKTQACEAYTGYLLNTAVTAPYEVSVGSLLPCFWVYHEVGKVVADRSGENNPYKLWIDTYGGDEFEAAVSAMKDIADRAADRSPGDVRESMLKAFVRSTEYELGFYEAAYRG